MSKIFEHPIFKDRMKLKTIEKRMKNNIFTVFALQAQTDLERSVVTEICGLVDDFGIRAGAIYLCAYKFYNIFGCGETLKIATEMIFDLSYNGYYKDVFDSKSKQEARYIFGNLGYWISYAGSHPVYFNNGVLKRRMSTINGTENYEWYKKHVLAHLTLDDKISLANMMILNCVKNTDDSTTTEVIAVTQTKVRIMDEYYALCNEHKKKASKDELRKMKEIGEKECVI